MEVLQGDLRSAAAPQGGVSWIPEQQAVVEADPSGRILVDAGPGTGKTATACGRIAWLIDKAKLNPSAIWLVSFTRTAVHELRNRIASYLSDPEGASALRIATIDAHAWAIHSGFDSNAALVGTFDDNIERVIQMVQSHEGVFEYLSSVEHLIIDEAQDVVGKRCELMLEMIHALPESTGISIFSDEAQSIYGFSEEAGSEAGSGNLPEKIREFMAQDFTQLQLDHIHRSSDPILVDIFQQGRLLVKDRQENSANKLSSVIDLIKQRNHGDLGLYRDDITKVPPATNDTFLLFRKRGDALDAAGYLGIHPHRLRMSGLPTCIHGWIAVIFWDWTTPTIDLENFAARWQQRIGQSGKDLGLAWSMLVKQFGISSGHISVSKMVSRLSRAAPPCELTMHEFGSVGPLVGTIHGSKGREASEVRLYLPKISGTPTNDMAKDDEAQVFFVGATRAKNSLKIGKSSSRVSSRNLEPSGRAYTLYTYSGARAAVEIGRANDVDAVGLVGRSLFSSSQDAENSQRRIMGLKADMDHAHAIVGGKERGWRYEVLTGPGPGGERLCFLAEGVNQDLFKIAQVVDNIIHRGKKIPPTHLNHLRTHGVRTIAISADDPIRERLHSPWRESGIVAAPMLIGYPIACFR